MTNHLKKDKYDQTYPFPCLFGEHYRSHLMAHGTVAPHGQSLVLYTTKHNNNQLIIVMQVASTLNNYLTLLN